MARIRWNRKAFKLIRALPGVMDELDNVRERVQLEAFLTSGGKYDGGTELGRTRARAWVVAVDGRAHVAESKYHTLQRALAKEAKPSE